MTDPIGPARGVFNSILCGAAIWALAYLWVRLILG